jgi:hypothetical protein
MLIANPVLVAAVFIAFFHPDWGASGFRAAGWMAVLPLIVAAVRRAAAAIA